MILPPHTKSQLSDGRKQYVEKVFLINIELKRSQNEKLGEKYNLRWQE